MAIRLSTSTPTSGVDEQTGNAEIIAPESGQLELQDSAGQTQIRVSDGLTAIGDNVFTVSGSSVDSNQPANMNNGLAVSTSNSSESFSVTNSSLSEVFKVEDNGDIIINSTVAVDRVVSVITENDPNNATSLGTVNAFVDYVHARESGVLAYNEISGKAAFDTFLLANEIDPTIVLVVDNTPFDYTDTKGNVETGLTWWLGIVEKPSGGALSTSALFNSNSQNALTGPEIASALYAESNTNRYTDSEKAKVSNLPTDTFGKLAEKLDATTTTTANIPPSTDRNYLTDAEKVKLSNVPTNTITSLDNKLSIISSGENIVIDNPGSGSGSLTIRNSTAPVDQKDFVILGRLDGSMDIESRTDSGSPVNRWTFNSVSGSTEFPGQIIQNGNNVLDASDAKYSNLPNDTNAELLGKVDKVAGKSLSENDYINADKSKVDNLPNDTNSSLNAKANINGQVFTGVVQSTLFGTTVTNAQQAIAIGNGGVNDSGDSMIAWRVGSSSNARTGNYRAQVGMNYNNGNFEISTGNSTNTNNIIPAITINSGRQVSINGSPALNEVNITTDINESNPSKVPSASTVKAYVDANSGSSSFDGTRTLSNGTTPAFVAKRSNNTNDVTMMASQNSGSYFINRIYVDESDSGKIKFALGSEPDITGLTDILEIGQNIVEVKKIGTAFHTNGDIFAFNDGDMAARDISAVRKFSGSDFRLNGSLTDSNWSLYKATQGNTNGPEGTKAANGRSFSGEAVRIRVNNSATQGFIVENSIGLNLFEINGSTGIVTTANNHEILGQAEIHGDSNFRGKLAVGANANPQNALDVYGAFYVTGNALFKSKLTLEDNSDNDYSFESRATGISLRAINNPSDGNDIFTVESSGNSKRLAVPHIGDVTTSNDGIRVGTDPDGANGNQVFHEGNRGLVNKGEIYLDITEGDNPLGTNLTTQQIKDAKGSFMIVVGVGAVSATMPTIADFGGTNGDFQHGETITIINMNSGSGVTLSVPSGYQQAIGDLSVTTTNPVTISAGNRVTFVACDGTSYSSWGRKTWCAFDPNF